MRFFLNRTTILLAGLLVAPVCASAQTPAEDLPDRQALLAQAQAARTAGEHQRAIEFGLRAGELRMTPSLRSFLAQEYFVIERFVPAHEMATACLRELDASDARNQEAIRRVCERVQSEAQARAGRIVLRMPGELAPGSTVLVNGESYPSSRWSEALLVAPGEVRVRVQAPGFRPFEQRLPDVRSGERHSVLVRLQRETSASEQPALPAARAPIAPWVLIGFGAASLATTALLSGVRSVELVALEARVNRYCTPASEPNTWSCSDQDRARIAPDLLAALDLALVVTGSVGGALAAGGLVWYLAARPTVRLTPRASGAALSVSF